MQSKKDQLQAHLFVLGRVVSALTRGEPDAAETPMRRFTSAALGGILIAALILGGFAVGGLIFPRTGTAWRTPGTLIIDKNTGTRYVLDGDVLHPLLNYASARLAMGAQAPQASVPSATLEDVRRGPAIGIPGAPDSLPAPTRLDGHGWTLCADPGTPAARTTTAVDDARPLTPLAKDHALLVRVPAGTLYLAWHDQRMPIPDRATLAALGYGSASPWPVSDVWVAALTAGPDLTAPPVPHRGDKGPRIAGHDTRAGQILAARSVTDGADTDYFLTLTDGIAPLTATQAALLLGDPRTRAAYPGGRVAPVPVTAADAAAAAPTAPQQTSGALPPTPPPLVQPTYGRAQAPCVQLVLTAKGTLAAAPRLGLSNASPADTDPGSPRALLTPGAGVLAQAVTATEPGPSYLVTDLGVKYPLASGAASALGYSTSPRALPAALLDLIPTGPVLDPKAALVEQPVTPATPKQ
ncbi:type VII secretion protein EccB [Streptomyces mirabilis]|uniref:type VII secretion protein EccB n=1 Tax=Streptomyces mirabilis TaxID=68239 RepID=UPI0036C935EB